MDLKRSSYRNNLCENSPPPQKKKQKKKKIAPEHAKIVSRNLSNFRVH